MNCPLITGLRPCECNLPRCPKCNYTKHDAQFEGDHHNCNGKIPELLSKPDITNLSHGQRIFVWWSGGNGPFEYIVFKTGEYIYACSEWEFKHKIIDEYKRLDYLSHVGEKNFETKIWLC